MSPLLNPQFKRIRIDGAKELSVGTERVNAARQIQKSSKPVVVGFGKILDLGPVFQAADDGTDRDDQNIMKLMDHFAGNPLVGHIPE